MFVKENRDRKKQNKTNKTNNVIDVPLVSLLLKFEQILKVCKAIHISSNKDQFKNIPAGIYLLKVNNRNIRTRYEICSKLTTKIPERRRWRRSGIFIVNFEHISHLVLVFLLLILNT